MGGCHASSACDCGDAHKIRKLFDKVLSSQFIDDNVSPAGRLRDAITLCASHYKLYSILQRHMITDRYKNRVHAVPGPEYGADKHGLRTADCGKVQEESEMA